MIGDYRRKEIYEALIRYHKELNHINVVRLELSRQEKDAWTEFQSVLLADHPEMLSKYFEKNHYLAELTEGKDTHGIR